MAPKTLPPLRPTDVVGALVFLGAIALFAWTIVRIVFFGV
jgi:hypothetical protein